MGMVVVVGSGSRAKFWSDVMIKGSTLKEAFPKIFSLAVNKMGFVKEYVLVSCLEIGDQTSKGFV